VFAKASEIRKENVSLIKVAEFRVPGFYCQNKWAQISLLFGTY
jgi:hypothetical protein